MRLHNLKWLEKRRRQLRTGPTLAEARLWRHLQRSQVLGKKFRRQQSAGPYILDFYCPNERLAVELDGASHDCDFAQCRDRQRDEFLRRAGIRVLRFQNIDVMRNLNGVMSEIGRHFNHPRRIHGDPS